MDSTRLRRHAFVGVAVAATLLYPASNARAHFILQAPASWMPQDADGLPEKLGPCGDEDDGVAGETPTGIVTAFQQGQMITVTVEEVIFHPGHYRIALAVDNRSELPAEPTVTAGATPCGTVPIESPAVFPVLADDVFDHTTPFTTAQSVQIALPPNVTCTKCTLQVIEFMSDHPLNIPGGCFYHHCADISIQGAGADAAGGEGGAGEGGTQQHASSSSSGCASATSPREEAPFGTILGAGALVGLVWKRRRAATKPVTPMT